MYDSDEIVIAFDEIRILVEFDTGERRFMDISKANGMICSPILPTSYSKD